MLTQKEYDLLKGYENAPYTGPGMTEEIRYFRDLDYIHAKSYHLKDEGTSLNPTRWTLTSKGRRALEEFENHCQDEAKKESQQRFDNKIAILNVLVPLVTFILGLLVEYFTGVVNLICKLF